MESSAEHLMRADKNRCIRIPGVEIYLGKLMRSTALTARWNQQELMLETMRGELIARYDFTISRFQKERNIGG